MADQTREPQYQAHVGLRDEQGLSRLGLRVNAAWHADPKRLGIVLSRYKFVAKMLSGKPRVLEVGCGDAWASRVVRQEVESLVGIDFDPVFVEDARAGMDPKWEFEVRVHDMMERAVDGPFDAAYALDVIEPDLKRLMQRHFHDVFIFSMNDEVIHTGFHALAHYLFALCVGKRS